VISKLGKKNNPKKKKKKAKKRPALDEKSNPIQWTEFPTSVLVGAGSCRPEVLTFWNLESIGKSRVNVYP
jgi:hypothetical protein